MHADTYMEPTITKISAEALIELVCRVLTRHGMSASSAAPIAKVVMQAERDGSFSHGIFRLPAYVKTLQSGYVNVNAVPVVTDHAKSVVRVDADNGFAQPAIEAARERVLHKARSTGIAALAIHNSHHFAALWPDVENFAEQGLVALAFVNSRMRIAPWDAPRRLIGTNPMAFACPRDNEPPLVWDQASSVMAQGQVLMAAQEGRELEPGMLIDADGQPTTDPNSIQQGGALRSFGEHKGSSIALMVEIMAAALTGANFGFQDVESELQGSATQNAGELILVIDPNAFGAPDLGRRVVELMSHLRDGGVSRFPSESRHRTRQQNVDGIPIDNKKYDELLALAGVDVA